MHNIHVDCTLDDVRGYFLGRHTAHLQLQCAGFSGQFTRNKCPLFGYSLINIPMLLKSAKEKM